MTMARPGGNTQRIKEYLIAPAADRQGWCVVDGRDGDVYWSADRTTCVAWATGAGHVAVLKDAEIAQLRAALLPFVDAEPCRLNASGGCMRHEGSSAHCDVARARAVLGLPRLEPVHAD